MDGWMDGWDLLLIYLSINILILLITINIKVPHFTAHLNKDVDHRRTGSEHHLRQRKLIRSAIK